MEPKVIFEDESILVIDKPADLVVTSSETQKDKTLEDILSSQYGINLERSGIVHRLDKDTSGLLVVGKTLEAVQNLQAQFKSRIVKKKYLALVHGWIKESGRVEAPIARNPLNREQFVVQPCKVRPCKAREAMTEYEPIQRLAFSDQRLVELFSDFNQIQMRKLEKQHYGEFTLLACYPLTGRTHQIRVHLKYLGNPVVGDDKYAGRKMKRLDRRWCLRQFLHAAGLEFIHPVSGERLSFESKLPEDLEKALAVLDKKVDHDSL